MAYDGLSEEGFSPPNREVIVKDAFRILGLTPDCTIVQVEIDGVALEDSEVAGGAHTYPDDRDPSTSVWPIYAGLPSLGKRY